MQYIFIYYIVLYSIVIVSINLMQKYFALHKKLDFYIYNIINEKMEKAT
jgi:hypothetical protein